MYKRQTLTIDAAEGGTVKVGGSDVTLPYSASVEAGTDVVVDAVASPKYAFTGWSGTYGSVNSQFAFTVGSDVALKANFEKREGIVYRTINIEAPAKSGLMVDYNGAQISLPAKLAVADGDTATLKVVETDDSCYKFKALVNTEVPICKGSSGVLIMNDKEAARAEAQPCIRCAKHFS